MINRYIIKKEYNLHDIDEIDIKGEYANIMWHKVLIEETENPISVFEEALYNLILDYNIVYTSAN